MFGTAPSRLPTAGLMREFVDSATLLARRFRRSELPGAGGGLPGPAALPHLSRLEAPSTRGRIAAPESVRAPSSRFPLVHRPSSIAVIDDDPEFLEALSTSLPWEWHVEGFRDFRSFLNHLQQEPPRRERDYALQQEIVDAWRADRRQHLVAQVLAYWRAQPERFGLTSLCICGHVAPGESVLDALAELGDWGGARVLLNGPEDAALATEAFNRRLIDRSLPRNAPEPEALTESVLTLTRRTDERAQNIWSGTLGQEQSELLRADGVAADLRAFAERTWLEWVCLGEPFGVLGLDFWGAVSWLQLQPASAADGAAEVAAQYGARGATLANLRAGRLLSDAELAVALGQPGENQAFLPAFRVGTEGRLLAAFRPVAQPRGARAMPSYRDWLRRQKVRQGKL